MGNLKFLLDADDVLLDTGDSKVKWMRANLTDNGLVDKSRTVESIAKHECNRTTLVQIIGEPNYEKMTGYVYSLEGTLSTPTYDGALQGVSELAKLGDIHVISARKPQDVENTKAWLKANGFYQFFGDNSVSSTGDVQYSGIAPVAGSKKVGIALHRGATIFVDDDERHMPSEPVGVECILFGPGERLNTLGHIQIAKNWGEVIRYVRTRHSYK